MLDLRTKKWTDKDGVVTPIRKLQDIHLVAIQNWLRGLVKDKESYIAQRQSYWNNVACQYDAAYYDKDWYNGNALNDIESAGQDDYNKLKVALMLVSEEVNKRFNN